MPDAIQPPPAWSSDTPNSDELCIIATILSTEEENDVLEFLIGLIADRLDDVYRNSPGFGWRFSEWARDYYRDVIRQLQRFIQPHPSLESSLTGMEHHVLEEAGDEASNRPPGL